MIDIEQIANLIKDVGFPIFVSAYLLIRIERKLDQVIAAINGQKEKKGYTFAGS